MSNITNKYGLILPDNKKSNKLIFQAKRNVFGEESDSEGEGIKKPILLRSNQNINRQAKISQEKAVKEDPTVYQYDEIYDSMTNKLKEETTKIKEIKKPKYIENLLKTAHKRKIENERRVERQVQKERETEGDEFADKEVFVTSAYKKKLEEMREEDEKEKREEYLESIGDVTKQKDLGGFYRHLYEQRLGADTSKQSKDVKESDKTSENKISEKELDPLIKIRSEKSETSKNVRNYRKRKSSDNAVLSEGEIQETDEEINRVNLNDIRAAKKSRQENLDADSDFSIDDSSDEEGNKKKPEPKDENLEKNVFPSLQPIVKETAIPALAVSKESKESLKEELPKEPEPKIDVWKKRTVGEVFEQALKRYYERKSARGL